MLESNWENKSKGGSLAKERRRTSVPKETLIANISLITDWKEWINCRTAKALCNWIQESFSIRSFFQGRIFSVNASISTSTTLAGIFQGPSSIRISHLTILFSNFRAFRDGNRFTKFRSRHPSLSWDNGRSELKYKRRASMGAMPKEDNNRKAINNDDHEDLLFATWIHENSSSVTTSRWWVQSVTTTKSPGRAATTWSPRTWHNR